MTSERPRRGFTLIELVLVMMVLSTVLALAAPRLAGFMWGRNLEEEARRLLSLSRYGRSLAVSQSTPMRVWVHPEEGLYGLAPSEGYTVEDEKEFLYHLPEGMNFELPDGAVDEEGRGYISFWPDGTIDELSLTRLVIHGRDQEALALVQKDLAAGYEIVDHHPVVTVVNRNAKTKRTSSRKRS